MSTALVPDPTDTQDTTASADAGAASSQAATDAAAPASAATQEITYTLTLPDHAALPTEAIERTTAIARELGLSNEAAQKVLESMNQEASSLVDARVQAALESARPGGAEWTKQAAEWERQTMEDTSLGKTPEERKATIAKGVQVIDRFAQAHPAKGKALRTLLNETGMGNHPQVVGFFSWLGKAASEPQEMVKGSPATPERKSTADVLYGKKKDADD